jgi:outer membrane immunogenic protein
MFKKIAMVLTLALASTASYAGNFDGLYAGVGAGLERTTLDLDESAMRHSAHDSATKDGYLGSLFAGYSTIIGSSFYLGGELNVDGSTTHFSGDSNVRTTTARLNRVYGISVLPGFVVSDNTLVYARLGLVKAHYSIRDYADKFGYNANKTGDVNGKRYGVGVSQNISPNLNLRLEYSRINYSSINTSGKVAGLVTINNRFSPKTDRLELGLSYHFG